jgi:hypothetical protein
MDSVAVILEALQSMRAENAARDAARDAALRAD